MKRGHGLRTFGRAPRELKLVTVDSKCSLSYSLRITVNRPLLTVNAPLPA